MLLPVRLRAAGGAVPKQGRGRAVAPGAFAGGASGALAVRRQHTVVQSLPHLPAESKEDQIRNKLWLLLEYFYEIRIWSSLDSAYVQFRYYFLGFGRIFRKRVALPIGNSTLFHRAGKQTRHEICAKTNAHIAAMMAPSVPVPEVH